MSLLRRMEAVGEERSTAPGVSVHVVARDVVASERASSPRPERVRIMRLMMDRVGFSEVARIVKAGDVDRGRLELRPALEAVVNADERLDVTMDEREQIIADVLDDVVGLGPLQPYLEDDAVTEIMVNGRDHTFIERRARWLRSAGCLNRRSRFECSSIASSRRWVAALMSAAPW